MMKQLYFSIFNALGTRKTRQITLFNLPRFGFIPIVAFLFFLIAIPELKATEKTDCYFTLTKSNIRNKPSLIGSKVIGVISGGHQLKNAKVEGDWVRFTYKGDTSFILSRLVGPSYFPLPNITNLTQESKNSWLLSFHSKSNRLFVIYDAGWEGAVDGPSLEIHVFNVKKNKIVEQLQLSDPPLTFRNKINSQNPDIWRQKFLNYAWNKAGVAIQNLLQDNDLPTNSSSTTSVFQKLSPEDSGLQLKNETVRIDDKKYNTLKKIKLGPRDIWRKNDNIEEVVSIASVIRLNNQFLRITLNSENLNGCCDGVINLHVETKN